MPTLTELCTLAAILVGAGIYAGWTLRAILHPENRSVKVNLETICPRCAGILKGGE